MSTTETSATPASPSLFVRNSTGLVRGVSQRDNLGLAFLGNTPVNGLSAGVLFALAGFPGGNFLIALVISIPLAMAFAYAYGLMSAAIPRSGGDYMIVSRVLHPALGLISSICYTLASVLSLAFLGIILSTIGLGPGLTIIGRVADNTTLVDWGDTLMTSEGWQFAIGSIWIILGSGILLLGWRWTRRIMTGLFFYSTVGLLFCVVVALFTTKNGFISSFNDLADPLTGNSDTYASVIAGAKKAGVDTDPSFSLSNTIPLIGVVATFGIFAYSATYLAGELRQANTTKTAHRMGLGAFLSLSTLILFMVIFFSAWGKDFLTAGYAGQYPAELGTIPAYFVLTSAALGSPVLAVLIVGSFLAYYVLVVPFVVMQPARIFFAYAFDGVLPRTFAKVSRTNAPVVATAAATLLVLLGFAWGLFVADNFVQVIIYATLIQLISMGLVAVSAILLPRLRPALYRASSTTRAVLGVPVVTLAGVIALGTTAFLYYLYFKYEYFGLADKGKFFIWLGGALAAGTLYYLVAAALRRRQGIELRNVYAEIPPE